MLQNPAEGIPSVEWLYNFVVARTDNNDFNSRTGELIKILVDQTVDAWLTTILSQRLQLGYNSHVDLDAAISSRTAKATQFLKIFRGSIRSNTLELLSDFTFKLKSE